VARRETWARGRLTAGAVITAAALGGCGLRLAAPQAAGQGSFAQAPEVRFHELPTPPGRAESVPAARSAQSPQSALTTFADVYINWTAQDVKSHLLALAADCVGQARTAIQLSAVQTGADPELRQAGIANHGTVEAVAPLPGGGHRYVVITRESTSATNSTAYEGLAPAWHLTVATVTERGGGWVISGWQPES
jgi:hypothetical protein